MSRSHARECVFKLVFVYLFNREDSTESLDEVLQEDANKDEVGYISEVYHGVVQNFDSLVSDIKNVSTGFKLDRIFKVDLAILLVALYEMKNNIALKKVCINEALNLAKIYSTDKSASYINGILSNFVGE